MTTAVFALIHRDLPTPGAVFFEVGDIMIG